MKYIELEIFLKIEALDLAVDYLYGMNITDMVIDDPRDVDFIVNMEEEYRWDYLSDNVLDKKTEKPKLTIYFENKEEERLKIQTIKKALEEALVGINSSFKPEFKETNREDLEWRDKWKEFFKPSKISDKFVVKPSWEEYTSSGTEKIIEIDPGMAFGTGTHETTSLCVKMMEEVVKEGDKILDVGCGSGILSIAGAMLGASHVLALDIDEVAVKVTEENLEKNQISDKVTAKVGDLTKGIDYEADVVVANLMADLVMELSKDVKNHMIDGGYYISSGILNEKVVEVVDSMRALDFKILEVKEDGMWSSILCQK